jgi:hypothetical protein
MMSALGDHRKNSSGFLGWIKRRFRRPRGAMLYCFGDFSSPHRRLDIKLLHNAAAGTTRVCVTFQFARCQDQYLTAAGLILANPPFSFSNTHGAPPFLAGIGLAVEVTAIALCKSPLEE